MPNITLNQMLEQIAQVTGVPVAPQPPYARLSAAMERLGFQPTLYLDSKFIAETEAAGGAVIERLANGAGAVPPVTIFWTRDDGQQVIQCAKEDGTSALFWTNAGADLQSQLAYLAERFAAPAILDPQAGATGQQLGTAGS